MPKRWISINFTTICPYIQSIEVHLRKEFSVMIVEKHLEEAIIHSYQTNQHGEVKVSALFNLMLEASWAHATKLNWGYDSLKDNQMFWALSRIRIEIIRLPRWRDKVTLETWPSCNDRMFAYREFRLKDEAGNELLRANSAWLVLDLTSHKIVSFAAQGELPHRLYENPCTQPKRLRYIGTDEELQFYSILYSDIDVNKHFNSVRAFERVIDNHETNFLQNHQIESIEINYLKEGFVGQEVAVAMQEKTDLLFQSAIIRQEDNEPLSLYEMKWN